MQEAQTSVMRDRLSTAYGLNRSSCARDIPHYNLTTMVPEDIMHVMFEGLCIYELKASLNHFVEAELFEIYCWIAWNCQNHLGPSHYPWNNKCFEGPYCPTFAKIQEFISTEKCFPKTTLHDTLPLLGSCIISLNLASSSVFGSLTKRSKWTPYSGSISAWKCMKQLGLMSMICCLWAYSCREPCIGLAF